MDHRHEHLVDESKGIDYGEKKTMIWDKMEPELVKHEWKPMEHKPEPNTVYEPEIYDEAL